MITKQKKQKILNRRTQSKRADKKRKETFHYSANK